MADDMNVKYLDKIKLPVPVEYQYIYQSFIVAPVDILIVLGYDFMMNKMFAIDIPNRFIKLNNNPIVCFLGSQMPTLF